MALASARIYTLIEKSLAAQGIVIRTGPNSVPTADPTVTSGSGAPSDAEPDGSIYLRTGGGADTSLYVMVSSSWVALEGAGGAGVFTSIDLDGALDQDIALTGTGDAQNVTATISHATQVAEGIDVSIAQITNVRTSGTVTGVKSSVTSLTGDTAGVDYYAFEAGVTVGEATADHLAFKVGAGFDAYLDLTSAATGEADVLLADNLASAWQLRQSTDAYVTIITTDDLEAVEFGQDTRLAAGARDRSVTNNVHHVDDFFGIDETSGWILNSGADAEAIDPAFNAQEGGVVRCTTGDADGTVANDGSQLVFAVPMQADSGGMFFECRLKIVTAITTVSCFVGFTDSTALEEPVTGATDTLTFVADDAVGFLFDSANTTQEWFSAAADGTVADAGNGAVGTAPVADTYQTLRGEISADGATITLYIDDVLVDTLTGDVGVSPDVDLFFTVIANATTTTSKSVDVDWVAFGANR